MAEGPEGVSPVTVLIAVAAAAAAVAYVAMPRQICGFIASNESSAVAAFRTYLGAQNAFHRSDRYRIGRMVYANPKDGTGFPDLYELGGPASGGVELKLIDLAMAWARPGTGDKDGYCFADITGDARGPYEYAVDCGLSAAPVSYNRSGRNVFIVDVTGTVYQRDAGVQYPHIGTGDAVPPLTTYPDDSELAAKWIPVGCE